MKKWVINYYLPEDVQPNGGASSRSYECQSSADSFGKVEDKFLKKYPTAIVTAMRTLGAVEEL